MRSRNKRLLAAGAAVVVGAILIAIVVIASGDSPQGRYGDRESTDARSSGPAERPASVFGQTLRLRTYLTTIEVRPLSFVRLPATGATRPGYGVDLSIRNVGRAPYRDQPVQAAQITLRNGGEAERVYTPVGSCRGPSTDTVRIQPGASERFCVPFEAIGRPDLFVYSAEDGLPGSRGAPETGAWSFSE